MKINYLNCEGKHKLFSFTTHNYKEITIDEKYFMLDGGFSYIRWSGGTIEEGEIKDLIKDVRESFTWGKNKDKDGNILEKTEYALLKDLTSSHICGILSYFNNKAFKSVDEYNEANIAVIDREWLIIYEIFTQELLYRINNKLI
jgi:hypothetical protein